MRRFPVLAVVLLALTSCTVNRIQEVDEADVPRPSAAPAPVPEARTEVAAAPLGAHALIVAGGFRADGSATDRVDVYDLSTGTWAEGPPLPEPRHHAAAALLGARVFVAGGCSPAGTETDTVWSLGPGEGTWRNEPRLGTARCALGLAATGDRLVAFGGTSSGQVLATAEVLRLGTDGWRSAPSLRQPREHTAAAAGADGRVYAIGGRVGSLESNLSSVESLDPSAFAPEWRREPDLRTPRGGIAAAAVGRTVCVAGGEATTGTIPSVECLRDGGWRDTATLAEPRHGLGVVAGIGRELHVLAGGPRPGLFVSTAHEVLTIPVDPA